MFKKLFKKKNPDCTESLEVETLAPVPVPKIVAGYVNSPAENEYDYAYGEKPPTSPISRKEPPALPETEMPTRKLNFKKDILVTLPVQSRPLEKRIESVDDDDYGYCSSEVKWSRKKDAQNEKLFLDARDFALLSKDSKQPIVSRFFFKTKGNYYDLSTEELMRMVENKSDSQMDVTKYVITSRLPALKNQNSILSVIRFARCKNKSIKNFCITEVRKSLLFLDPDGAEHTLEDAHQMFEAGLLDILTLLSETKNTVSTFVPLIQLGVIFSCFFYLIIIEAVEDWQQTLSKSLNTIQSKFKKVKERKDPAVKIFVSVMNCLFDIENTNFDESHIMGEDLREYLPDFTSDDSVIFLEGFVGLYHTANKILRQESDFARGVEKFLYFADFYKRSDDRDLVVFFDQLFVYLAVQIFQMENKQVITENLMDSEKYLLSGILQKKETLGDEMLRMSANLLFHPLARIRELYVSMVYGILKFDEITYATEKEIERILDKFGFRFLVSSVSSKETDAYQRKRCVFCDCTALVTYVYEQTLTQNVKTKGVYLKDNDYVNVKSVTGLDTNKQEEIQKIKQELEILKTIESEDFHTNVSRLLTCQQNNPMFYIKEHLCGDTLQRTLLDFRKDDRIIEIESLIHLIIQAIDAIIYVHSFSVLVRDITTASFACTQEGKGYLIKLDNFQMAVDSSHFGCGGIVDGCIDMNFEGVPTRWAAPESLLGGRYSIHSDVWSANILADEILNYAAWPFSEVENDHESLIQNIVFTNLKPQGFNRPRRIQGLLLEGLATEPEHRLKLEAFKERLVETLDQFSQNENEYDCYVGSVGSHAKVYSVPDLTIEQEKADSVFQRGIPEFMKKYRASSEDPCEEFHRNVAMKLTEVEGQTGMTPIELSSDENYKVESGTQRDSEVMTVIENVSNEFLQYTFQSLNEIDGNKMCIKPWPPRKVIKGHVKQLHFTFPRSACLLDTVLHKELGKGVEPYIYLLYEIALHVDNFHTAGWIVRCLRARNIWILEKKNKEQIIVIPKFGSYRKIASAELDVHFEQLKIIEPAEKEMIRWLPVESMKAGLYSKESDVYAFGMVCWEVFTAFGIQGTIYNQDEEIEMSCVPLNYLPTDKILQYLIDGHMPDKPIDCPDWFYFEVMKPCLLHQKIDRPSFKRVAQVIAERMDMSQSPYIDTANMRFSQTSAPPSIPRRSNISDEVLYDTDRYESKIQQDLHYESVPDKTNIPSIRQKKLPPLPDRKDGYIEPVDTTKYPKEDTRSIWIKKDCRSRIAEEQLLPTTGNTTSGLPPPIPPRIRSTSCGNDEHETASDIYISKQKMPLLPLPSNVSSTQSSMSVGSYDECELASDIYDDTKTNVNRKSSKKPRPLPRNLGKKSVIDCSWENKTKLDKSGEQTMFSNDMKPLPDPNVCKSVTTTDTPLPSAKNDVVCPGGGDDWLPHIIVISPESSKEDQHMETDYKNVKIKRPPPPVPTKTKR